MLISCLTVDDRRGMLLYIEPQLGSTSSSSLSAPISRPSSAADTSTMTKKQRQHKKKALEAKEAKAEAERERQAKLAAHQRARLNELYRTGERQLPAGQWQTVGKSKDVSGGMRAGVSESGQLIWE
jgi:uncharacterized protein YaiL (DUF2058 family)